MELVNTTCAVCLEKYQLISQFQFSIGVGVDRGRTCCILIEYYTRLSTCKYATQIGYPKHDFVPYFKTQIHLFFEFLVYRVPKNI